MAVTDTTIMKKRMQKLRMSTRICEGELEGG